MAKDRPPTYTPAPELPSDPELRSRFSEIVNVLAQSQTVTGAARTLGLSRNHFQTILHRVIAAMIEEITPKPAGRPSRPEREVALEAENQKLRAEVEALRNRAEVIERMMTVVGGIASGKTALRRSRSKKTKPEDPEPATLDQVVVTMTREAHAPTKLCAQVLGVSPATVRRRRRPASVKQNAKPTIRVLDLSATSKVRDVVCATHGAVGAASLGRLSGLPRRVCAEIKSEELRRLERARKARCARITIAAPRIVRGFDAMYLAACDGDAFWLVAADAAVPFRTSITTVPRYDASHVVQALRGDFERFSPPLVLRLDRAACHLTRDVEQLLDDYQVLTLHGPPRYPQYYGQLERQNREHRAWYRVLGAVSVSRLPSAAEEMRTALNTMWPRPSLNGWTAEQAWRVEPPDVDRRELRRDVDQRTTALVTKGIDMLHARRIAIETELQERGLLSINQRGWR
jgi:hypothetical protein